MISEVVFSAFLALERVPKDMADEGSLFPFRAGEGDLDAEERSSAPVWIHVPARQTIRVCLLADLPVRFETHWVDMRARLCLGRPRCGHCVDRMGTKVHYVYPAYDLSRRQMGAIDFTPNAQRGVREAAERLGFLRGLVVAVKKEGGVQNGRLIVEGLHSILDLEKLGPGPDVVAILSRQYGLGDLSLEEVGRGLLSP